MAMGRSPSRVVWLAAASTLALAGAAHAEAAPQSDSAIATVDEIIVTAAPYGISARASTIAVDVLDEAALRQAPAATLGDILNGLPGVRSSSFSAGASRPVIRGLGGPRVQVLSNGLGLIDASALSPDHQVAADPGEAVRIEVLRGPQTLAFGGSAIGGVVNVLDGRIPETQPINGREGHLSVQASSVDDGWSIGGGLSVGRGPLVFTVDAQTREAGDYEIPVPAESRTRLAAEGEAPTASGPGVLANSFSELTSYGAGVSWIGARGFVGMSVKRTESDYGAPGHAHAHDHEDDEDPADHHDPDVTLSLAQTRYDLRGEWDLDLGPFRTVRFAGGYADYTHTEFEDGIAGTRFESDGYEGRLELVQAPRDGWEGAIGVQALRRDFDAIGPEAYVPRTRITEVGAFALQRLDRGDWGLEGGLRADRRELDSLAGQASFSNLSGSAGLFWRPTRPLFLGLSVAANGRAPTEAELFANGPHAATGAFELGDAALDSERVVSVEGTAHFGRGPLSADLHLFVAEYDGFIDLIPTGAEQDELPVFVYAQTDARFHGMEIEVGYEFWRDGDDSLTFELGYDTVRGQTDLGPPARIPPWSLTGRAEAQIGPWTGRLELRGVGAQRRTAPLELGTGGYHTLNAFLGWRPDPDSGLLLYVEGRNLTDQEVREHASFLKDLAPSPGRNVRVGAAWRF